MQQESLPVHDLTRRIVRLCEDLGFDRCAAAPVERLPACLRLEEWLGRGMNGTMAWMARSAARRCDPASVVPGARSVLVVAMNYHTPAAPAETATTGCISCYAQGDEYHRRLGERLEALCDRLCDLLPGFEGRWYVDTGPVLEKAWAERAGLGWIGKHTNLISRGLGSWIFLGAVILDVELDYGNSHRDYCGTCEACMDACPTDAIVAPYQLDARRCISYLTIENRGPIPVEFRRALGNRIFGCDDCQDVCPWNRFARTASEASGLAPRPENLAPGLVGLLSLDEDLFRARFRDSPVLRAKRRGFLRNVAVALGNSADPMAIDPLVGVLDDSEELIRGHAAWALGELGGPAARAALRARRGEEEVDWVRGEIDDALEHIGATGTC